MKNPSNPGGATNKEDNYPYKRMYTYSQVLTSIWVFKVMGKKPTSFASLVHKGVYFSAQARFLCTSAAPKGSPKGVLVKPVENYCENTQAGVPSWTELFGFILVARALWISSASWRERGRAGRVNWRLACWHHSGGLSLDCWLPLIQTLWLQKEASQFKERPSLVTAAPILFPPRLSGFIPNTMLVKETLILPPMFRLMRDCVRREEGIGEDWCLGHGGGQGWPRTGPMQPEVWL